MGHSVVIWRITSTFTGTANGPGGPHLLAAGNYIHAILDDATNTLTSKYSSSSTDNTGFDITDGPSLFSDPTGAVVQDTLPPLYQYCEGTTLHQVGTSNGWPYATLSSNTNNSACTISNVCDLEISSVYTVTPASGPSAADGSIVGSASSSNGLIKFSRDENFVYGSSNPSGVMPDISLWTNYSDSSDPLVWTQDSQPYCTLTAPSSNSETTSDKLRSPYSTAWVTGQKYTFNYSFRAVSTTSRYRIIVIAAYDEFMNKLAEKNVAGYGSPSGTEGGTLQGQWELFAPAGMRYMAIHEYFLGIPVQITDILTVLQFAESVTADAPGVQTELNFTGLLPGAYTIYAKDAAGCQDSLNFVVSVTEIYGIRYRHEFKDYPLMSGRWHRIDIEERSYIGEIEAVCAGDKPIVVNYMGDANDPSLPLVPSNADVQLLSEINEQFAPIFLSDDRKYRVKYYTDTSKIFSSPTLFWTGWVVPEFYSEPYLAPEYVVTVTVSDQLGELQNQKFRDEAGNKFRGEMPIIKILAAIFKLTDLDLPMRCGINVWADIMDQEHDPLRQAYLDMRIFEDMTCAEVLESIATSFRGQICQSQGYWWFYRLSDAVGTFEYREFDKDGEETDSGMLVSIKELGPPKDYETIGGVFSNRRQVLSFMRNYGQMTISNDLAKDGNLIDEGRFEYDDIEVEESGNIGFKRWSVTIGQPGVTYGFEEVENGDSKGALFIDYSSTVNSATAYQNDTIVYSEPLPFDIHTGGKIRFMFDYSVSRKYTVPYTRVAWALKYISGTGGASWWVGRSGAGTWTIFNHEIKNDIYVTSFDDFQTFDLLLDLPTIFAPTSVQIFLYCHDHRGRDFHNVTELKAFDLSGEEIGIKKMVSNDPQPETYLYKSEYSYDAESIPDVVRPDDYNSGDANHRILWRKEETIGPLPESVGLVSRVRFDNVVLASYPTEPANAVVIDPPQTLEYTETIDPAIKSNLNVDALIGDMLRIDPETDHYKNERYIYRSYIRTQDGTPTKFWHRQDVNEEKYLLRITLEDYIGQFSTPQRKLSGTIVSSQVINFVNSIRDNVNGKRYRPMTFSFDAINAEYTVDMVAVNGGPDGEPPVILGAYDHNFSTAYDGGINDETSVGSFDIAFNEEFE